MNNYLTGYERLIAIDVFYKHCIKDRVIYVDRDGNISKTHTEETVDEITAVFFESVKDFIKAIEKAINRRTVK